jgi:hypothetical protein
VAFGSLSGAAEAALSSGRCLGMKRLLWGASRNREKPELAARELRCV